MSNPFVVFDTHPIQYRSPVFRWLNERGIAFRVYFFNATFDSERSWYRERGQIPEQNFGLSLEKGFSSENLALREKSWWERARSIYRVLKSERPKSVLLFGYYEIEHWLIRLLCGWREIPLIFVGETFSDDSTGTKRLIKKILLGWFFKGVHRFISIGDRNRDYYLSLGIPPEKISEAKYCIDNMFFSLDDEKRRSVRKAWRDKWRIPADAFVVLFVGRLVERKRPRDVLAVHRQIPGIYTVIVGNGLLENSLRDNARDLANVIFTGFQDQNEIKAAYHAADLLLVPSEFETWGLVVNEAFACRLPAAVTDTCGVAGDLVVPGLTGHIAKLADVPSFVDCINELRQNPGRLEAMRNACYRRVVDNYSVSQMACAIEKSICRSENPPADVPPQRKSR